MRGEVYILHSQGLHQDVKAQKFVNHWSCLSAVEASNVDRCVSCCKYDLSLLLRKAHWERTTLYSVYVLKLPSSTNDAGTTG
jgi:hypothetical protein